VSIKKATAIRHDRREYMAQIDEVARTLANVRIMDHSEPWVPCIDVLEPTVEELGQVTEIALAETAVSIYSPRSGISIVHSSIPSIVVAHSLEGVVVGCSQYVRKVLDGRPYIIYDVLAVSIWRICAFIPTDLHHSLLSASTLSIGVAARFLKSKSGNV